MDSYTISGVLIKCSVSGAKDAGTTTGLGTFRLFFLSKSFRNLYEAVKILPQLEGCIKNYEGISEVHLYQFDVHTYKGLELSFFAYIILGVL